MLAGGLSKSLRLIRVCGSMFKKLNSSCVQLHIVVVVCCFFLCTGSLIGLEGWAPSAYLERTDGSTSQRTSLTLPNVSFAEVAQSSQNQLPNDAIYPRGQGEGISRRSSSSMCASGRKKSFSESSENLVSALR